ncbi:type II toxin-antitoxin system RelE/ParE family toxin [Neorhizobium galegae]|uniref:type II toxin-antitoxin system RelE/ParE family toxin n=1 Tax=Neorhizobium galegae TaxID=399 RepID=UPI000627A47F|nr:type II toxin-antitoxin system RelE/ParE family toxin [Neorhizobium galegae]MCQ1765856.1 type II toxin-antitoxin system RelE/ParE family toxin [Neorhizobium galegae]MCQ1844770.1 type II toxin-antitoxin system RelE/ParE family toxin [Neorhizobium galegae]
MAKAVLYSSRARDDMLDIWSWIADKSGLAMADAVAERIEARISRLADHPEMGPARSDIAQSARMLVIERWLALYAIVDDTVRIVRVVDGSADLRRVKWDT